MLPTISAKGAREAFLLLTEIAARARDASPAWDVVADDVFAFEHDWWARTYGTQHDAHQRDGRDPRFMFETGGLHDSATRRGAQRQTVEIDPYFVLIEVTSGLAGIHERRGREVLGEPGQREADKYAAHVADFILTGSLARG